MKYDEAIEQATNELIALACQHAEAIEHLRDDPQGSLEASISSLLSTTWIYFVTLNSQGKSLDERLDFLKAVVVSQGTFLGLSLTTIRHQGQA